MTSSLTPAVTGLGSLSITAPALQSLSQTSTQAPLAVLPSENDVSGSPFSVGCHANPAQKATGADRPPVTAPLHGQFGSITRPSTGPITGAPLDNAGADINLVRPNSPATALHMAASHDLTDIASQLVHSGARMEVRSANTGRTPLLTAASSRASRTAIELLRLGANFRTRDGQGYSAIDYAGGRVHI